MVDEVRQGQACDLPKVTHHVHNQMRVKISSPFLLQFRVTLQGIKRPQSADMKADGLFYQLHFQWEIRLGIFLDMT